MVKVTYLKPHHGSFGYMVEGQKVEMRQEQADALSADGIVSIDPVIPGKEGEEPQKEGLGYIPQEESVNAKKEKEKKEEKEVHKTKEEKFTSPTKPENK